MIGKKQRVNPEGSLDGAEPNVGRTVRRTLTGLAAAMSLALVAVPATASAAPSTAPSIPSTAGPIAPGTPTAEAITEAEAQGGTVLQYHSATNTWTQVSPGASTTSQTSVVAGTALEPDASPAAYACMLALSICSNFAAQDATVMDKAFAQEVAALEVLDGRELNSGVIDTGEQAQISDILDGADKYADETDIAGTESGLELGIGDAAEDLGSGLLDLAEGVAVLAWVG